MVIAFWQLTEFVAPVTLNHDVLDPQLTVFQTHFLSKNLRKRQNLQYLVILYVNRPSQIFVAHDRLYANMYVGFKKTHTFHDFKWMENKKLSYRRESAHLTSLYRTVKKAFRMLNGSGVDHEFDRQTDRQTDERADRQTKAIAYSDDKPISINRGVEFCSDVLNAQRGYYMIYSK